MNPQKKPRSRQEILKKQQQSIFVGREEHLTAFRYNLALPPADWWFLFSVWGQGGVGKSTLLRQFRRIAEEAGFLTAHTSDSDTNVLEVMGRVAEQLEQQGHRLNQFAERYKVYLQKKQELEADPDAPQGFSAFLGKSIAKASLGLAKQVPGSGAVTPFLDEDAIANQAGDWAAYVAKKIGNKDEVRLVQKPVEVLTPLFLQDLGKVAEQKNLLLLFDTYERTVGFLDSWLREILEGHYGDLPINIILVIAGREELERNHWADYQGAIARISLEPFTEEEARQYLSRKGITNPQIIDVILRLSGRLPLLLATLAAESPSDPTQVGDPSGTAVERFLQWVDDPKRRQVALDAALPRYLNRDVIAVLHGEESADELFNWLKQMPFVEERSDGWVYHDIARTQMLRHKRISSPQGWAELHSKLSEYFDEQRNSLELSEDEQWHDSNWQTYSLHFLYHYLCQASQQHLLKALSEFLTALETQLEFAQEWARTILQAGKEYQSSEIQNWGELLVHGLRALSEIKGFSKPQVSGNRKERIEIVIEMFTKLLEQIKVEEPRRSMILGYQGEMYGRAENYEEAIRVFNQAIELNPNDAASLASRGLTHYLMGQPEKALHDLNRAIKINPKYTWALSRRGFTYQGLQRDQEALEDFNQAIEYLPKDDLSSWWYFYQRGKHLLFMKRYEEALEDFNRAIEQLPEENERWHYRYKRALVYQILNQPEKAKADLNWVIQFAQGKYNHNPESYSKTFDLALYHLAANNIEQAKHFYGDALRRGASQSRIKEAIQDLEDFLKVFSNHRAAQQIREVLLKRIGDSQ